MQPRILVLAGSTRNESLNRKLARQAVETLQAAGADATLADLRDYPMPLYDGDLESEQGLPATAKALKELARSVDGFAIASPEYNGGYSAVLKNAIDWISRPEPGERPLEVFREKVAAVLSASPSPGGGRRNLRQLRELLEGIKVTVIPQELSIAGASDAFDAAGRLVRAADMEALQALAAGLALAVGRKNQARATEETHAKKQ